jgi:GPI transamidase subunit PIG-U
MTDVQPSMGVRWYLMLEMFNRYKYLYRTIVAIHPWVYVYPLHCIFHKYYKYCGYKLISELFTAFVVTVVYINHPHPTFYEYFVCISLFLPHYTLVLENKASFFTLCSWVIGSILSNFMWSMWTDRMGGNSNFFFFQTIFSNLVIIGFLVSLLYLLVEKTNRVKFI